MNSTENNEYDNQFCFNKNQKNVLYIDANNMIFRAFHAAKATNNNPIHILTNMVYSSLSLKSQTLFFIIGTSQMLTPARGFIFLQIYKINNANQ